ncbi:MAG TPA: DUF1707 domain-containing protein [Solirubrobacteraceae bacterium]|jgi:hypothetical protein
MSEQPGGASGQRTGMSEQAQPGSLLASDAEREQSIVLLRDATVEGRLTLEEFSARVGEAQLARTHGELEAVTRDLPVASHAAVAQAVAARAPAVRHRAICSRLERRGPWELPSSSSFSSIFGTIELDLRQARLSSATSELAIYNLFGTVTVIVPDGIEVSVEGGGAFASQVIDPPATSPAPGAPVLRIRASGPGGTLYVRHNERPNALARMFGAR